MDVVHVEQDAAVCLFGHARQELPLLHLVGREARVGGDVLDGDAAAEPLLHRANDVGVSTRIDDRGQRALLLFGKCRGVLDSDPSLGDLVGLQLQCGHAPRPSEVDLTARCRRARTGKDGAASWRYQKARLGRCRIQQSLTLIGLGQTHCDAGAAGYQSKGARGIADGAQVLVGYGVDDGDTIDRVQAVSYRILTLPHDLMIDQANGPCGLAAEDPDQIGVSHGGEGVVAHRAVAEQGVAHEQMSLVDGSLVGGEGGASQRARFAKQGQQCIDYRPDIASIG